MLLRLFPALAVTILSSAQCFAQQNSYYVIIGGFAIEENAATFMEQVHALNLPAIYAMNPERNLYYVYVRSTDNKGNAYATLARMQEEGFNDAWVFNGYLPGRNGATVEMEETEPADTPVETTVVEAAPVENMTMPEDVNNNVTEQPAPVTVAEPVPAGKPFIFKLINSATGNPVTGQVHLLESERANQYRGFKGNEKVYIVAPANRGGKWHIACRVVGFQLYRKSFTYADAQQFDGASLGPDDVVTLPLELERVRKGDYIEMDNVKFSENSNAFKPESERELSELVAMMQENPDYEIKLHGHTSGDHSREMIAIGEDGNFFAIDASDKRMQGNAKQLSTLMAETVRNYLISKGIEESRMDVRGEGGKQPIFDPKGTLAANNARVEVEITKH